MKSTKRRYVMVARSAQAEATKTRIRDCAMQLYAERSLDRFTLEEVARRAETTVQTVLRVFKSKENLIFQTMVTSEYPKRLIEPTGDAAASVAAIFDVYEAMGDNDMRRLNDEHRFPALKPGVELGRGRHREWVRIVFAPQLGRFSRAVRAQVYKGLVVATDVYTWKILRRDERLSRAAAEAVVRRMVDGLLHNEGVPDDKGG